MMQRKPLQLQGVPVPDESSKDITAKTLIDATQEIGEAAAQETITNLQQCCHPLFHRPGLSARRRALARAKAEAATKARAKFAASAAKEAEKAAASLQSAKAKTAASSGGSGGAASMTDAKEVAGKGTKGKGRGKAKARAADAGAALVKDRAGSGEGTGRGRKTVSAAMKLVNGLKRTNRVLVVSRADSYSIVLEAVPADHAREGGGGAKMGSKYAPQGRKRPAKAMAQAPGAAKASSKRQAVAKPGPKGGAKRAGALSKGPGPASGPPSRLSVSGRASTEPPARAPPRVEDQPPPPPRNLRASNFNMGVLILSCAGGKAFEVEGSSAAGDGAGGSSNSRPKDLLDDIHMSEAAAQEELASGSLFD